MDTGLAKRQSMAMRNLLPDSLDLSDPWFSFLCALAAILVCSTSPVFAAEPTPAQKLILRNGPLIIAHRGNSSEAPENTLPAFQSALEVKADLVELDYYHSADGALVVIHDEFLDRTTDAEDVLGKAKLLVGEQPLSALQRLDAGSWFDEKFAGTRLPMLIQALDLIQTKSVTLIERKAGDAKTLVKLLGEKNLTDKVVVQSFDWDYVADCRKLAPRLALCTLSGKPANDDQIRAAAATGADVIVWNHEKIGHAQIELIHQLGKKAWVYTVDEPPRAKALIAGGIDGIITNVPAEMIRLRGQGPGARGQ
jgi:glycerophosphoryl diester phosphodiesterase